MARTLAFVSWLIVAVAGDDALAQRTSQRAMVHWERVPLRDAVRRLEKLFPERVFLDRRIDPALPLTLDLEIGSSAQALAPIAEAERLGVSQLRGLTYLGPRDSAERLPEIAAERAAEIARLPRADRLKWQRRQPLEWPKLTEPRRLVIELAESHGWRIANAEQIPHDLWPAGNLPALPLAERLSVLLIGFDMTFELNPIKHEIAIVAIKPDGGRSLPRVVAGDVPAAPATDSETSPATKPPNVKQVYTLRVRDQPVSAVLREFSQRLKWSIEIDETAIKAAGKTLDARVSFAVENVDEDALLEALLKPAGLTFRREGEQIKVIPLPR